MKIQPLLYRKYFPWFGCIILCMAGLTPLSAYALSGSCDVTQVNMDKYLHTIDVPHGTPVNAVIESGSFTTNFTVGRCSGGDYQTRLHLSDTYLARTPTTINGDNVFPTDIPGIGVAMKMNGISIGKTTAWATHYETTINTPTVTYKIYKTGNVKPGSQTFSGELLRFDVKSTQGEEVGAIYRLSGGPVSLTPCSLGYQGTLGIDMGTLFPGTLTGKGSTASPVGFNIPLDCDANTRLNISFQASSTYGDGVIDLTNSSARGLGIKLMLNDAPVKFGQASYVQTTSSNGRFNIPLTAAYAQTESDISPGTVNAVANFTVTFD